MGAALSGGSCTAAAAGAISPCAAAAAAAAEGLEGVSGVTAGGVLSLEVAAVALPGSWMGCCGGTVECGYDGMSIVHTCMCTGPVGCE
eukprot:546617-Pelagomonas_calceolata.AAC.9